MLRPLARHAAPATTSPRPVVLPRHGHPALKLIAIVLVLGVATSSGAATVVTAQSLGTATLAGTVSDGDRNPLADVHVVLKRHVNGSAWLYHETTSDDAGAYTLSGLEAGDWNASFRLDGYRSQSLEIALGALDEQTENVTLDALLTSTLRGTVRDAENEAPIAGAVVSVASWTQNGHVERETTSDADGAFSIRLFAAENSIRITKGGYGTTHDYIWSPGGDVQRDFYLHSVPPQNALLTGRVVDADGRGIQAYVSVRPDWSHGSAVGRAEPAMMSPGAEPDIWYPGHADNHNSTVTARDGSFEMRGYAGAIVVDANRAGYLVARTTATLTEDGTTAVTLELEALPERTVTITGTVRNASSGGPIAGADVSVNVPAMGDHAWTTTDENGRFQVTVRPGYTLIEVNHWGRMIHHAVTMEEAEPVRDDGDAPASSGNASTTKPAPSPPAPAPPADPTRYHPVNLALTTQADSTHDLDIAMPPRPAPTTTVVGYVVDAQTNQAIPNARIALQNHDTGEWGDATTDDDGSFRFQTHAGYHTLRVWLDGYLPSATNVQVQASGTQRADLFAQPGQYVEEGWWHPDGESYDDHDAPRPPVAYGDAMASEEASFDGAASRAAGETAAFNGDGPRNLAGGPGGLGPYTPMSGEGGEAPAPGIVALIAALAAALAGLGARRRHA